MKGYFLEKVKPLSSNCHYAYKIGDNLAKLFYARIGSWTGNCKGKRAVSWVEDPMKGEFTITFKKGVTVTIDICELAELVLLVKAYGKAKPNTFTKYTHVIKGDAK